MKRNYVKRYMDIEDLHAAMTAAGWSNAEDFRRTCTDEERTSGDGKYADLRDRGR